jgi:hypothetical protein
MLFSKEVFDGKRTKGKLSNIASRDADVRGYTNPNVKYESTSTNKRPRGARSCEGSVWITGDKRHTQREKPPQRSQEGGGWDEQTATASAGLGYNRRTEGLFT